MKAMRKISICFFVSIWCVLFLLLQYVYAEDALSSKGESDYLTSALQLEKSERGILTDLKLPSIFEVVIRFLFSLLIIIGFILGGALVYKKFFGGRYFIGRDTDVIKVLAHRYLDPKKSLYLVEIGQKILVIGASAEQLHLITEITDPDGVRSVYKILEMKSEEYKSRDFKSMLSGFTTSGEQNRKENNEKKHSTLSRGITSVQSQIQKIKRMINET